MSFTAKRLVIRKRNGTIMKKAGNCQEGRKSNAAGLRIILDTMLGENEATPFCINGTNVTREREYRNDDTPRTWLAFDSLDKPGIISQGILYKNKSEVKPDVVQFTNWRRVKSQIWDYHISPERLNRFISLNSGEMQLNISFDCNQYLEVGHELEVHFRIHTPEWKNYDLENDYSRNAWDYTETDRIFVYEGDKLISGRRSADG